MLAYGNYGYFTFLRAIAPEDPVRGWGVLLGICLENFLILLIRIWDRGELVGLQARVPWVYLQLPHTFAHLPEEPFSS